MRFDAVPTQTHGTRRARRRFALTPTKVGPHVVWLQTYWELQYRFVSESSGDWWAGSSRTADADEARAWLEGKGCA